MINRQQVNILTSVVPEEALEYAKAKSVIDKYLAQNEKTLDPDLKKALLRADVALANGMRDQVKPFIEQLGLDFWAEIFGTEGSRCERCKEGLCTAVIEDGDYVPVTAYCGYCYLHEDKDTGKDWHVCIKTHRAMATERSLPFSVKE